MKKTILFVIASLMIVLPILTLGCSSDNSDDSEGSPTSMMKMLPQTQPSEEFTYVNLAAIRSDGLEALYAFIARTIGLDTFGTDLDQVDYLAGNDEVTLIQGSFNWDSAKRVLAEFEYEARMYEGAELLESANIDFEQDAFAFLDPFIILGPPEEVKDCISVIQGKQASLYDNKDFKDVVGRLAKDNMIECEEFTFRHRYKYDGLQIAGTSIWKKDQDTMSLEGVLKFQDANTAELAMDQIENDMKEDEGSGWSNINVTRTEEYIRVTADQPISYLTPEYPSRN